MRDQLGKLLHHATGTTVLIAGTLTAFVLAEIVQLALR